MLTILSACAASSASRAAAAGSTSATLRDRFVLDPRSIVDVRVNFLLEVVFEVVFDEGFGALFVVLTGTGGGFTYTGGDLVFLVVERVATGMV